MTPKQAQRWANALRSGKYFQGRGRLRVGNTFCCLGVLCDINGEQTFEYHTMPQAYDYPKTFNMLGKHRLRFFGVLAAALNDEGHYETDCEPLNSTKSPTSLN